MGPERLSNSPRSHKRQRQTQTQCCLAHTDEISLTRLLNIKSYTRVKCISLITTHVNLKIIYFGKKNIKYFGTHERTVKLLIKKLYNFIYIRFKTDNKQCCKSKYPIFVKNANYYHKSNRTEISEIFIRHYRTTE